jgi:hypothetical protein
MFKSFILKLTPKKKGDTLKMFQVTRVYTLKKDKTVKKQAFYLAPAAVESVRPSTVLKSQKATIRTVSGMEIPVTQSKQEVLKLLGSRVR